MLMSDTYGIVPGITTARETYESEFRWGSQYQGVFGNGLIDGATVDASNSPTYELRPGLLLGLNITTGKYTNYSPTATNGSEVASAILLEALRMQGFDGVTADRFYAVLVGGPVQAAKILGLDGMARQQMDKFMFDDSVNFGSIPGNHWYPWKRQITKTAAYTCVLTDNFTQFNNLGATGSVAITLPPLATVGNGFAVGILALASQTLSIVSNEGANIVWNNTLTANSLAFSSGGGIIGGSLRIYSNPAGTKWYVDNASAGNTVTAA